MTKGKRRHPARPLKEKERHEEPDSATDDFIRRMNAILGPFNLMREGEFDRGGRPFREWFDETYIWQDIDRVLNLAEEPGDSPLVVIGRDKACWMLFVIDPALLDRPARPPVRPN